jgi:hypothetical protein
MKRYFGFCSTAEGNFVAEHFCEIERSVICGTSFEDVWCRLSSSLLKLDSEDSLLRIVVERMSESVESYCLFEFHQFEHLNPVHLEECISLSSSHFDQPAIGLWNRLCLSPQSLISQRFRRGQEFAFEASSPFCGLISYLTENTEAILTRRALFLSHLVPPILTIANLRTLWR